MTTLLVAPAGGNETRGPGYVTCMAVTTAGALATVCLRFYVRVRIVRTVGWDDWMILAAMVSALIAAAFSAIEVSAGFGRRGYYLSPRQAVDIGKWGSATTLVVAISSYLSKISICLLLLRLLGDSNARKRKRVLYSLMVVLSVYNGLFVIIVLVQCRPIEKLWDKQVKGVCWSPNIQTDVAYVQGALLAISAFVLSAFPVFIVKNLQLNLRAKIALCLLMGLGAIDGVCSIVRTSLIHGIYQGDGDYSYIAVPVATLGWLEMTLSIIAACLPTIRPLFRFFDRVQNTPPGLRDRNGYTRHQNKRGDPLHQEFTHRLSVFSKGIQRCDEEYGMTNHASANNVSSAIEDTGSEKSTAPLRDVGTIRKTTEIEISR